MPTNVGSINVNLTADMRQFAQTLERARKQLKQFGDEVQKSLGLKIEQTSPKMERLLSKINMNVAKIRREVSTLRPAFDKATAGVQRFNGQMQKAQTQAQATGRAIERGISRIGSPAWLRERGKWFLQLRGMWALFTGATQAVRDVVELDRSLHDLKAVTPGQ